jgi:hypothetical protein
MPESNRRTPRKIDVHPPLNPIPPILGLSLVAVGAYLYSESAFGPHPIHWLIAAVGGAIGLGAGYGVAWAISRLE